MKIIRQKAFSESKRIADEYDFKDEEWAENTKKEAARNKIRDQEMKKLTPREQKIARYIYQDVDNAGNRQFEKNQNKSRAIGAGIGTALGAVTSIAVARKMKGKGKIPAAAFYSPIIGAATGALVANKATEKKNRRVAEKIWEKGDKEQLDYITSNKKKKRDFINSYTPIENRVDRKSDYSASPKKYKGPSLEERAKREEELEAKFVKSLKNKKKENDNSKKK